MGMLVMLHDGFGTHSHCQPKTTLRDPLAVTTADTIFAEDTLRNLVLRNTTQKSDLELRPKSKGERFPLLAKELPSYARGLGAIGDPMP